MLFMVVDNRLLNFIDYCTDAVPVTLLLSLYVCLLALIIYESRSSKFLCQVHDAISVCYI